MKTPETKLLFAGLMELDPASLFTYAIGVVKLDEKIATSQKSEREARKFNAKVVSAMKRHYIGQLNARAIAADTSFKKYFESNAKGTCPGRVQSLAGLFNSLVLTDGADQKPLLSEEFYDAASLDALEKANAIVNAAIKEHGDGFASSSDVIAAIAALSTAGDASKKLDAIRKQQKAAAAGESEDEAATGTSRPLTAQDAIAFLVALLKENAAVVLTKPENGKELFASQKMLASQCDDIFTACDEVVTAFETAYGDDTMKQWLAETRAGVAEHIQVITQPSTPQEIPVNLVPTLELPAPTPDAEAPAASTETPAPHKRRRRGADAEAPAVEELANA